VREPLWLREDVVRAIHSRQLAEHGGAAGVRNAGLLDSALARPKNLWACNDPKPDLASLAASYACGIVKNHAFVDGNKRTGFVVLRTFLLINGCDLAASPEQKCLRVLSLAGGTLDETGLADWIRARMRRTKRRAK